MYSNLTLYYLNQMGIVPWVTRESYAHFIGSEKSTELSRVKLLILLPLNPSHKAQALFKQIINFINLPEADLLKLHVVEEEVLFNKQLLDAKIILDTSLVAWSLGLKKELFLASNLNCTVIHSDSIDHLLQHPQAKKKMFADLSFIKKQLSTSSHEFCS